MRSKNVANHAPVAENANTSDNKQQTLLHEGCLRKAGHSSAYAHRYQTYRGFQFDAEELSQRITPENIDLQDSQGSSALHVALITNQLCHAEVLLQHHADVNLYDKSLFTPLHCAVRAPHVVPRRIIEKLITPVNLNCQDRYRCTPLHLAVRYAKRGMIHLLIDRGADINVCDKFGHPPMHYFFHPAEFQGQVYLSMQQDKNIYEKIRTPVNINAKIHSTTLECAVDVQMWAALEDLLSLGADVDIQSGCNTILELAVSKNAPCDVFSKLVSANNLQTGALCAAIVAARWDIVSLLVSKNVELISNDCPRTTMGLQPPDDPGSGAKPLHLLAKLPQLTRTFSDDIVYKLISPRNVSAKTDNNLSAFAIARSCRNVQVMRCLIQHVSNEDLRFLYEDQGGSQPGIMALQSMCVLAIRANMPAFKPDQVYEGLQLPHSLTEYVKLKGVLDQYLNAVSIAHQQ